MNARFDLLLSRLGAANWPRRFGRMTRNLALLWLASCSASPAPQPKTVTVDVQPPAPSKAVASAPLMPERVVYALAPARPEIRACLEHSGVQGALPLHWSVDASGNALGFESPAGGAVNVPECLTQLVGSRMFDAAKGTASARWTFVNQLPKTHGVSTRSKPRSAKARKSRPVKRGGVTFNAQGHLTPWQVDDVVQAGFKVYAHCLRQGIAEDLKMRGRLALRFTVQDDGTVSDVADAGSDIDDGSVVDCTAEAFYSFTFPRPEGGPVVATYAILVNEE